MIRFDCPNCGKNLKAPEEHIGKSFKCPKCGTVLQVPALGPTPHAQSQEPPPPKYFVRAADGQTYGPMAKADLDQCVVEGRLDASCQVMREGESAWRGAREIYPHLGVQESPAPPPAAPPETAAAGGFPAVACSHGSAPIAVPLIADPHAVAAPTAYLARSAATAPTVTCPNCGATQFFGRRRVTAFGWVLWGIAIVDLLVSIPLVPLWGIGICTMLPAIPLAAIGVYACRRHVNTCALCKRDF